MLSTTPSIEGMSIVGYVGLIGAEVVHGVNVFRDGVAAVDDILGGRSKTMESAFSAGREMALSELGEKARRLGANAVVSVRVEYQVLGKENGMAMVAATGTAVRMQESEQAKARREAGEKRAEIEARERDPIYSVIIGDRVRGPFSLEQLRKLHADGKVGADALVEAADGRHCMLAGLLDGRR